MFDSNQFFGGGGAAGFYPLTIDQSLRFNDDDSAYLSRTPASAGNQKTFTISFWLKMGLIPTSSSMNVLGTGTNNTEDFMVGISYDAGRSCRLMVISRQSSSVVTQVETSSQFRDPSAWYHFVISVDTTQATSSNRIKIYVNGVHQTSLNVATYPSQNLNFRFNSANVHRIGTTRDDQTTSNTLDGYLANVHFIDGTAYTADAFGELKSGTWVAKAPSVTYGTNGFHLDFANSADIGNDVSGEGNDWTPNNFTASDVVLDSPTNNFCTWNPLNLGGGTLSDGNLRWVASNSIGLLCTATMAFDVESTTNKYYWEVAVSSGEMVIGIAPTTLRGSDTGRAGSYGYYGNPGSKFSGTSSSSYGANFGSGDVIGVAVGDGKITFYKNGVSQGDAFTGLTGIFVPFIAEVNCDITANFGQQDFTYTPPTGYLALSTANLPDPVIDPAQDASPSDYFGTDIYTGNGGTIDSDFGFDCDLVWYKNRGRANTYHYLFDQVRGDDLPLYSNDTFAEDSQFPTYHTQSFITNGSRIVRTIGDHLNFSGDSYVAWAWKAGTSVSGTTTGSGTLKSYTGSVNTTSGFSIIAYEGNATAGHQIPHHLNSAPEMVIVKDRDAATNWGVGHIGINGGSNPWDYKLHLDLANAQSDDINVWNDTAPTSSVVTLGAGGIPNGNLVDYIMYCFHSVEGFSKFGSYSGNNSTDGPFIYLGFRPALFMVKCTNTTGSWYCYDTARLNYNVMGSQGQPIAWDTTAGEDTGADASWYVDALSNGVKIRNNSNFDNGGNSFIYMAFAENPFKYSNAR